MNSIREEAGKKIRGQNKDAQKEQTKEQTVQGLHNDLGVCQVSSSLGC